jgi:hypothetical protein
MEVSLEDAYAEACKVIGEQTVTLRFLQAELAKTQAALQQAVVDRAGSVERVGEDLVQP